MAGRPARVEGTLSSWNDERGFGFLSTPGDDADIFAHITAFRRRPERPQIGEVFTFEVELLPDGKRRAKLVRQAGAIAERRQHPRRTLAVRGAVAYLTILAFVALYLVVGRYWAIPVWVAALYLFVSALCFATYSTDKAAARAGQRRVPESTLLALGLLGGWPGAIVAQQVLRHKTIKAHFQFAFWGTVALNVAAFVTFTSPISDGFISGLAELTGI